MFKQEEEEESILLILENKKNCFFVYLKNSEMSLKLVMMNGSIRKSFLRAPTDTWTQCYKTFLSVIYGFS